MMHDEIMALKAAAEYQRLAEKRAYRIAAKSNLPSFKADRSWRLKQSDIEKWIEQNNKGQKE